MAVTFRKKYVLGEFELEPDNLQLRRGGRPLRLTRKPFHVLLYLVEHRDRVVSRQELLEQFWAGHDVYDESLTKSVGAIRKALDDPPEQPRYIVTHWAAGYRYVGPLEELPGGAAGWEVAETREAVGGRAAEEGEGLEGGLTGPAEAPAPPAPRGGTSGPSRAAVLALACAAVAVGAMTLVVYRQRTDPGAGRPAPPRSAAPAATESTRSLAVLPLKSLNEGAADQYLGLGIADSIISRISQTGALTVRPTSAVRKYVNSEVDSLEVGRAQKVDSVLDGTVQRSGDRLRVSVNLLRVSDGASLWADTFNVNFNDIFAMQDEVSRQIAARLRLKLNEADAARIARRHTSNPEAYNYYAKAMYHFGNISPSLSSRPESDSAVDLFKKAVELDPDYALAHAQLGYTYTRIAVFQEENPALIEQARRELAVAERLNPQLAEVHAARYFIAFSQYEGWQIETAFRELRLAQEIDPDVAHMELADLYNHVGLEEQAAEEFETALKIDPNNDQTKGYYVGNFFQQARPDDALELNKRFFNRGPDFRYYMEKGMAREAEPLIAQELQKGSDSDLARNYRLVLLALQGKHGEAQAAVPAFLATLRKNRGYHHYTYNVARVYALGGKSEKALKWLRVTVAEGFPCYPLFERDPFLDPIRRDPEFAKFLAEMKEQWEGYMRKFG